MKNTIIFSMLLATSLVGCNRPDATGTTGNKASPAAATSAATTKGKRGALTAEQLAQIGASGKTGLWADVSEVCANRRKRKPVMLAWNVQASGAKQVAVYLLDKDGKERRVAQGDAIGGRIIGRWLHPGSTLVLHAPGDTKELGRLVIGTKSC
jgi:hypothetical protein